MPSRDLPSQVQEVQQVRPEQLFPHSTQLRISIPGLTPIRPTRHVWVIHACKFPALHPPAASLPEASELRWVLHAAAPQNPFEPFAELQWQT